MINIQKEANTSILSPEILQNIVIEADISSLSYFLDFLKRNYGKYSLIHLIRGQKCKTLLAFFDEWAAALQFPVYFGENLDAFVDCLRELPLKTPANRIIVIANANALLEAEPSYLPVFYDIITHITDEWKAMLPNQPDLQLKNILHESGEHMNALKHSLDSLNVKYDEVIGDWLALI
jgi:RNAse (barnase) inhibitor barstar